MNVGAFFASLGAALLARLSSVGAALAAGFATIVMSFTGAQRAILLDVKTYFLNSYNKRKAAGASEIDAIEGAASDAFNEFCSDESKEFTQEAGAVITLLESSAKTAAGIIGATLQTSVSLVAPAAAGIIGDVVSSAEATAGAAIDKGAAAATTAVDGAIATGTAAVEKAGNAAGTTVASEVNKQL